MKGDLPEGLSGFVEPDGATPLDEDDMEGLLPTWVATRADLNVVEQENILTAIEWSRSRRWTVAAFDQEGLRRLHKRMFGDVWAWAGVYRRKDTNIGVPWPQIGPGVEDLARDLRSQCEASPMPWPADEIAVRFHHRLVSIHLFRNGNGRHARLAADLIATALGRPVFTWGGSTSNLAEPGADRERYISALRTADSDEDYDPLVRFARS